MQKIRQEFEKAFTDYWNGPEMPSTANKAALWAAKWAFEKAAQLFDYELINAKSKDAEKIRQLSKELSQETPEREPDFGMEEL